jgi:hypothetical protein
MLRLGHVQVYVGSNEIEAYLVQLTRLYPTFIHFDWQDYTDRTVSTIPLRSLRKLKDGVTTAAGVIRLAALEHWVVVFLDLRGKQIEFYDPLGSWPSEELITYMQNIRKALEQGPGLLMNIEILRLRHQFDGHSCGFFSLAYIEKRLEGAAADSMKLTLADVDRIKEDHIFGEYLYCFR